MTLHVSSPSHCSRQGSLLSTMEEMTGGPMLHTLIYGEPENVNKMLILQIGFKLTTWNLTHFSSERDMYSWL